MCVCKGGLYVLEGSCGWLHLQMRGANLYMPLSVILALSQLTWMKWYNKMGLKNQTYLPMWSFNKMDKILLQF